MAQWALFLFIFGLLAPFVLILLVLALSEARSLAIAAEEAAPFAAALGIIAEVLALILGIIGRGHVAGKIAWIGVVVVLGVAFVAASYEFLRSSGPREAPMCPPLEPPSELIQPRSPRVSPAVEAPQPVPKAPTTLPAGAAEAAKRQDEAAMALGISKELTLDLVLCRYSIEG